MPSQFQFLIKTQITHSLLNCSISKRYIPDIPTYIPHESIQKRAWQRPTGESRRVFHIASYWKVFIVVPSFCFCSVLHYFVCCAPSETIPWKYNINIYTASCSARQFVYFSEAATRSFKRLPVCGRLLSIARLYMVYISSD